SRAAQQIQRVNTLPDWRQKQSWPQEIRRVCPNNYAPAATVPAESAPARAQPEQPVTPTPETQPDKPDRRALIPHWPAPARRAVDDTSCPGGSQLQAPMQR